MEHESTCILVCCLVESEPNDILVNVRHIILPNKENRSGNKCIKTNVFDGGNEISNWRLYINDEKLREVGEFRLPWQRLLKRGKQISFCRH